MTYHIAPQNQGQMVEVAYATTGDGRVVRRTHDKSDRTTRYAISRMLTGDEGDYWQTEPRNRRWTDITEGEADAR